MKLTEEQKQSICAVYERAMTMREKFSGQHLLIAIDIDGYETFEIRAYEDNGRLGLNQLAADRVDLYDKKRCFAVIEEVEKYCDTFIGNKAEAKKARIAALEKELADLKAMED